MNVMHLKDIVILGGALSFYSVSCMVHVQPLPTKLIFGYFDRGSYKYVSCNKDPNNDTPLKKNNM